MPTHYIFLNPDGTQDFGVLVIVAAPTGVIYAHQCGGVYNLQREAEGFVVPVGSPEAAKPLLAFFKRRFRGNPPDREPGQALTPWAAWTPNALAELASLVSEIYLWKTNPDSAETEDERVAISLDRSRLDELTEAWIPVLTVYGPGILVFANSD
jgi:uncharacterized protein DUF6210